VGSHPSGLLNCTSVSAKRRLGRQRLIGPNLASTSRWVKSWLAGDHPGSQVMEGGAAAVPHYADDV
jgi:hypothetical protein